VAQVGFEVDAVSRLEHFHPVNTPELQGSLEEMENSSPSWLTKTMSLVSWGGKLHQEGLHVLGGLLGLEGLVDVVHFSLPVVRPPFHPDQFSPTGDGDFLLRVHLPWKK